uniref:Uncharacterized protein n=1 Tax=Branchiostoma floridae TaxID=7739 RepID=C3YT41_BRAFL|eukprot:XP_002600396.1 hypothetical protein BRAFLDRAFT_99588 [Branchiostoma floridae]
MAILSWNDRLRTLVAGLGRLGGAGVVVGLQFVMSDIGVLVRRRGGRASAGGAPARETHVWLWRQTVARKMQKYGWKKCCKEMSLPQSAKAWRTTKCQRRDVGKLCSCAC